MAKRFKTLILTDEHIALISNIKFEKFVFDDKAHYIKLKNMVNELLLDNSKEKKEINDEILNNIYSFIPNSRFGWGCDQWNLFGGTYVLEDVALILGYFDQAIENSDSFATGRRFPEELEDKMYSLYEYIYENLEDIISLVFYFMNKGGITSGTYQNKNNIWIKK